MPWLLASPGHQQPWYWLCRIGMSLSYSRRTFNYLCLISVEEWHKMWIYVYFLSEKISTQRVNNPYNLLISTKNKLKAMTDFCDPSLVSPRFFQSKLHEIGVYYKSWCRCYVFDHYKHLDIYRQQCCQFICIICLGCNPYIWIHSKPHCCQI